MHDTGHALLEAVAAAILVVGGSILLALAWRARLQGGSASLLAEPPAASPAPAGAVPATLSVAAGVIHLAVAPAHLDELGLVGLGFIAAGVFQTAWALAWLIDPSRLVIRSAIVANLGIAAVWLVSRTIGLPLGPHAGPEAIGGPDLLATTLQLALVALLAARLSGLERHLVDRLGATREASMAAVVPIVGVVMVATTLALAGLAGHGHADGTGHDPRPAAGTHPDR